MQGMGDHVGLPAAQRPPAVHDGNPGAGSDGSLTGGSRMDSAELVDDLFHAVYEFGVLDGQAQVSAVADPVQGRAHDGATCS